MKIQQWGIVDVSAHESVRIIMPSNLYGCRLERDVFVGPFVEIQSDVHIGARTRIQSHTFICSLVEIGEDCFIGHGVVFVNDKFQQGRLSEPCEWRRTHVADRVLIGSHATILPVEICSDTVIGAGSVVVKDILEPGFYAGNPAKKIR